MRISTGLLALAAILAIQVTGAQAQDAPTVKVDVKDMKVQQQQSPQISASNVTDKRWRPKNWLEVDLAFEAKKNNLPGDRSPFIESLEVKFYVALNKQDATGKYILLTSSTTFLNVMSKEVSHAMVFAPPQALSRLLEKTEFATADAKAWGVEINHNGQLVGGFSSQGGKFWEAGAEKFAVTDGVLLPKAKTPFAVLWGDYDLESKQ
ncbi:Amuc_1102 family pilus-like protein [Verrucomicrobium sp. BvORR106]|uniref:Amuc_1102 family pilus-like protein n=1 Tax=Verrucomicrobium sp. BvORR106 TaxID=1403819 RepID=UPI000570A497|nr:Amuc_1102 family pilus-like protein [Verrucomicrobium sp. BvORR106]